MGDFWSIDRLIKLVLLASFLMIASYAVIGFQQTELNNRIDQLEDSQDEFSDAHIESRERNRQVKGIVCRIEYALGLESSPVCVTPELLENYWSPENSVSPHFQRVDRE